MRHDYWMLAAVVVAGLLGGCVKRADRPFISQSLFGHDGRYVGVGIYNPGEQWTKMMAAQPPQTDTPAARPIDDQVVIVVSDTATGEIRACGDMTGYCIGFNPWSKPLAAGQTAPINLTEHIQPPPPPAPEPGPATHPAK